MMRSTSHYRTILLAALLAGCGTPSTPEQEVRDWVAAAEAAVEARDRGTLVDMISESYVDGRGNSRADLDRRLRLWFLRHRNIVISSSIEELAVTAGTAARVVLTARMAGTGQSVLGFSADSERLELELVRQGGEWLLIGASWRER